MKNYAYILGVLLLCSCNYFENKKIHASEDLIQDKLLELDKTTVDKFPIFENCESENSNRETEKDCFVTALSQHVSKSFSEQNLTFDNELEFTFQIIIEVTNEGEVNVIELITPPQLREHISNIDALVEKSVLNLPEIQPAYKKIQSGELIAVTTQFAIPVHIIGKLQEEIDVN